MARIDELRLMTKVARMYYEQELRQPEIIHPYSMQRAFIVLTILRSHQKPARGNRDQLGPILGLV